MTNEDISAAAKIQDDVDDLRQSIYEKLSPEDKHKIDVTEKCARMLIEAKVPFWMFAETKNSMLEPEYMQFNWCEANEKVEMDNAKRKDILLTHCSSLAHTAFYTVLSLCGPPPKTSNEAMSTFAGALNYYAEAHEAKQNDKD